jgi:hypothetical protein
MKKSKFGRIGSQIEKPIFSLTHLIISVSISKYQKSKYYLYFQILGLFFFLSALVLMELKFKITY